MKLQTITFLSMTLRPLMCSLRNLLLKVERYEVVGFLVKWASTFAEFVEYCFFIVYVNDMSRSSTKLFADDLKICRPLDPAFYLHALQKG